MGILWTAALLASLVQGGGGSEGFSSSSLVHYLADIRTASEMRVLKRDFGDENVASFLQVFDFAVTDALHSEAKAGLSLPVPDPAESGETLSTKLYQAGSSGGSFSAEALLDELFGHARSMQVRNDIDTKYGAKADANFRAVLEQLIPDLKTIYALNPKGYSTEQ